MTNLPRRNRKARVALVLSVGLACSWQSAHAQSINDRKTTARAAITGSPKLYDGSYASTGTSSVCGELPKEMTFTGVATFVIEFPSDGTGNEPIRSIAFGSDKLVGGVTTASVFRLVSASRPQQEESPPPMF